ncbi:MAG: hypothetical protein FH753_04595 [Firmicutes bacterium]|nr:hypothetical protein [Bacillota bacterium]
MNEKIINNQEDGVKVNKTLNFSSLIIPLFLLLTRNGNISEKLSLDNDFQSKVEMVKNIKPYFTEEEQLLLSKVQDVFDILNKVKRLNKQEYDNEINALNTDVSKIERKERILTEMVKYMDKDKRQIVDKVLRTKGRLEETKTNMETQNILEAQKIDKFDSLLHFIRCFEPIMKDSSNKKVKKIQKVLEVMKTPEDRF